MKVDGKGQPPAIDATTASEAEAKTLGNALERTGEAGSPGAAGPSEAGKAFAEKLSSQAAAHAKVDAPSAPPVGRGELAIGDVAAELRSGRLSPRQALDQVLERVVARQVGAEAPAAVRDQVRAALQEALESDPLLAEKLRQLS